MICSNEFVLRFILAGLACFRLSELIPIENGPFHIFIRLRCWLDNKERFEIYPIWKSELWATLKDLAYCPFCQGVWYAILLTVFLFFPTWITDFILVVFAIAGVQTILEMVINRDE